MPMKPQVDLAALKRAAAGKWIELLERVTGIPSAILDGQHRPCPKCGGTDRFRALDDFVETGAVFCNQCFDKNNGDGFAAIQWMLCCTFPAAVSAVGQHLGHRAAGNAKARIVATYDYRDSAGQLLFQVCRLAHPKDFRQRAPTPGGGWTWKTKGLRRVVYRLPELLAADPAAIVYVAEGEKAVDLLAHHGLVATCSPGGAGKWRGEYAEFFLGRRVVILADNDAPGRMHAQQVARPIHGIAASAKIVELPGLPDKGDVYDWLTAGGTVGDLQRLAGAGPEWAPTAAGPALEVMTDAKEIGLVKLLADAILLSESFAQDESGRLFHFNKGVYKPNGDAIVKARVKHLCILWERSGEWSTRRALEVVEFIRIDAPRLWDAPPVDRINVKNGILLIADRKLLPHDPMFLFPVQLPVEYDPAATCPAIEKFISEVFPADAAAIAYETVGWLAVPDTSLQKAILLTGDGANGKSTWLRLAIRILGKANTAGLSLHRLEEDRFAAARLQGKLANVCADLPSGHLESTSTFKALVGGDAMLGEHKFLPSFEFVSFARLVFSANHPPRSADASHAFFRRWLVVPFDRTFEPSEQIPSDVLDARLSTPTELSGLLNKAIDAYQAMKRRGGFSEPESILAAWNEFHATTDPLAVWLDRYTIDDPNAMIPRDSLKTAYVAECERGGRPGPTQTAFGRAIHRLRPSIVDFQRMVGGRLRWCHIGIGLTSYDAQSPQNNENDSLDSRGSRGSRGSP